MKVFGLASGFCSGIHNMALDEALLEWARLTASEPVLVVRTYGWEEPTLSLGVNQTVRDIDFLLGFYGRNTQNCRVTRRPTGGRAILHGEDVSFSFITNQPEILKQTLKESYAIFADLIQETLLRLNLPVTQSGAAGRDYLRSPVCFETHTPSDLIAQDGGKLCGSAQLRRQNGLLQHGAAFLKPYGITNDAFTEVLFAVVAAQYDTALLPLPMSEINPLLSALEGNYRKTSAEILASASMTSGSHLAPASF